MIILIYIYDATFQGLLTSIHEAFYRREDPDRILTEVPLQESLFTTFYYVVTDLEKAQKVYDAILTKISTLTQEKVYYAFLSQLEEAPLWIYHYLKLGFKKGPQIDLHLSDDRVFRIHKLCSKVTKETHLLLGLLRFKQLDENLFYAQIEPDYNILELITPHFAQRMADQNFIIHDLKRELASVYNQKQWIITDLKEFLLPSWSEKEIGIQNLWKDYFKTIAIKNRYNPKLQRKIMPVRYWKHLIEK